MKISILTVTWNRAYTLPNLYKSLVRNKKYYSDFEWLIMDDNSSDNTEQLINKWIKEDKIKIRYFKQNRKGKQLGLNGLLKYINGEVTVEIDSDDYFTDTALLTIANKYTDIKDDESIYGMIFNRMTNQNKVLGSGFPDEGVHKVFDLFFKLGVTGDTIMVFKSSIRKQFKHYIKENEGERRFVTEGRMYHQMDLKYRGLKCYNIPLVICEYQEDGYTKNILEMFNTYRYGHYYYYLEMFDQNFSGIPFKSRLHIVKHYILFSKLTNQTILNTIKKTKGLINILLTALLVIPGFIKTSRVFKENKKIMFIASTGGHLNELMQLKALFNKYEYHIVTDLDETTRNLTNKYPDHVDYLVKGTKDNLLKYVFIYPYNCLKSTILFFKVNPDVIISTGAHTAGFMCCLGKLFGKKIIFIESFANSESKTITGRLVYLFADVFIVQWESMLKLYPKAIYGGWIY